MKEDFHKRKGGSDQSTKHHVCNEVGNKDNHLAFLFQIVFNVVVVPDSLCIGGISPILKKNKSKSSCSSYRPVTASRVSAKIFELLIIDHLKKVYYTTIPVRVRVGLGCFHALRSLYNTLRDTEASGSTLVLGAYDVMNAFVSLIHSLAIFELHSHGVSLDVIVPLYYMYRHLKVRLKL